MGILDLFRKKNKNTVKKPETNPKIVKPEVTKKPETLQEVLVQEVEKTKKMTPKELKQHTEEINKLKRENEEETKKLDNWVYNNTEGEILEEKGKIDEAIKCYENNVKTKSDTPFTYTQLSSLYHYKKEFKKEKSTLKKGISRCKKNPNPNYVKNMKEELDNVEQFLNTGKWKYDCLPNDPKNIYNDIREAKTLLKSDEKEKGVEILETIMENGTYTNTVYNTLFQTYKKDKQFDEAIRVCNKAIEVLGFFSNDRKERWSINLEKVTIQKEKAKK